MGGPLDGTGAKVVEPIAYFVIRIRRNTSSPATGLTGTLERLGSGRARDFNGAAELLYLLTDGALATSPQWQADGE